MDVYGCEGTVIPTYRYALKAKIAVSGFANVREFCRTAKIDESVMSRVLRGWLFPDPTVQHAICITLGISAGKLRKLLRK